LNKHKTISDPQKLKQKVIDLETKNSNLEKLVEEWKQKHRQLDAENDGLKKEWFYLSHEIEISVELFVTKLKPSTDS